MADLEIFRRIASWFEGKDLSTDWLTPRLPYWVLVLNKLQDKKVRVLEIGSYEGRSTIAFLEFLPLSTVTAADFFPRAEWERRFDENLKPYAHRLTKIKSTGLTALDGLARKGSTFNIIYLDAAKRRDSSFAMSAAAWPLLKVGGIMIWDDLNWKMDRPDAERPASAIKLFCKTFASAITILHADDQMIIRKTADWPGEEIVTSV